jgi:mono/diheme cytochrome c family protein
MTHTTSLRLSLAVLCTLVAAGCHAHSNATPAANKLPPGVTMAMIAQGDTIFNTKSCKNCHGPNGVGGPRAPNLTDQTWIHIDGEYASIVQLVTTGFTKADLKNPDYPFSMNPRGGVGLTDDQIRAVAAYVWSLSHPGPH